MYNDSTAWDNFEQLNDGKDYISWEKIEELSDKLADKIVADCKDFDNITLVAVSRGGLVPTQIIAYKLNIRDIRVIKLISYDENNNRGEIQDISTDVLPNNENVYFIDDLADSGSTIAYLRKRFPKAKQCTLLKKDCCVNPPDFTCDVMPAAAWLVFPWD